MRIAFLGSLFEKHVVYGLSRALRRRGHQVFELEQTWSGPSFPQSAQEHQLLHLSLEELFAFKPEVVFCFRLTCLTEEVLKRLRQRKILLVAWFSDDPVLYRNVYCKVVGRVDIVLNCGNSRVMEFYAHEGLANNVNFPFWTDQDFFPYCYPTTEKLWDGVFLGNAHNRFKRNRLRVLSQIPGNLVAFGRSSQEYNHLYHGSLDSPLQIATTISKSRVAFSIPQYFSDYADSEHDFPELATMESFVLPSRVVQYASVGIPVISTRAFELEKFFPEVLICENDAELLDNFDTLRNDADRREEISKKINNRFNREYTSQARADYLIWLIKNHKSITKFTNEQRLLLFRSPDVIG